MDTANQQEETQDRRAQHREKVTQVVKLSFSNRNLLRELI